MSEYARFRALLETSDNASYVRPNEHSIAITLTPDEGVARQPHDAGVNGAALDISLAHMTTVTLFMVEHGDSVLADDVTVTWVDAAANVCTAVLTNGGPPLITPDVDPTTNPSLESAAATEPRMLISYTGT